MSLSSLCKFAVSKKMRCLQVPGPGAYAADTAAPSAAAPQASGEAGGAAGGKDRSTSPPPAAAPSSSFATKTLRESQKVGKFLQVCHHDARQDTLCSQASAAKAARAQMHAVACVPLKH